MELREGEVFIEVDQAYGGTFCLSIGDENTGHRLAGPKPCGRTVHQFRVNAAELRQQLDAYEKKAGGE